MVVPSFKLIHIHILVLSLSEEHLLSFVKYICKHLEGTKFNDILITISLCDLVAYVSTVQGKAQESVGAQSAGLDCISQGSIRDYTVLDNAQDRTET